MLLPPRTPSGTYWVPVPGGRVLAGPHPVLGPEGMEDRVKVLTEQARVRHFVDLSSSHDWMPPYRGLLPAECTYSRYEILDRRLPEDPVALRDVLRRTLAEAAEGRASYLHCQAGLGRTGTVVGVLLRELGYPSQDALDEIVRLRAVAGLHEGSPEFEEQREFIRRWAV